jgi:hypothetical protein
MKIQINLFSNQVCLMNLGISGWRAAGSVCMPGAHDASLFKIAPHIQTARASV